MDFRDILKMELAPSEPPARGVPFVINVKRRRNPLRMDPSRTTLIRKQFIADINRRWRDLKSEIWQWLVVDDELGLAKRELELTVHAERYRFATSDAKLNAFNEWLQTQIDGKVLGVAKGENAWTAKYVTSAYRQGINRAYVQARSTKLSRKLPFLESSTQKQFLMSAFNQPELMSKVKLLGTRVFNGMDGLTKQMKADLNRILSDGIVNGQSARKIARNMYDRIDGISKARALTIARTEVIYAQAEGQLDGLQALGIESVTAEVEWSTAGDELVCPRCAAMNGKTYTIDEARGLIPLHPNCRCAWIPVEPPAKKGKR